MSAADPRQQALIDSLRSRYAEALASGDAEAKQALFKEAVYLGIRPEEFDSPSSQGEGTAPVSTPITSA